MISKTIREYCILSAISVSSMTIISAVYTSFLLAHGLNIFQVHLINIVFFVTLFMCEIPTGAFADIFGRKCSYIVSQIFLTISMIVYGLSTKWQGFVIAEIFAAVGCTFASGAFRAWFVDKLKHHGHEGSLNEIFAKVSMVTQVTVVVTGFVGAQLSEIDISFPWLAGAALHVVAIIFALFLKEEYFVQQKFSFKNGLIAMKETAISSVKYGIGNPRVRFILIIVAVQIFALQALNMQWQPFFKMKFGENFNTGYVWIGIPLSIMIGAMLVKKIINYIPNERLALGICQFVTGFFILLTPLFFSGIASMCLFFLHEIARGAFAPIKDAYLHDSIPSKERATIESFDSMFHHIGGALGLLVSGFVALKLGIENTWGMCGIFLMLFTILAWSVSRKKV